LIAVFVHKLTKIRPLQKKERTIGNHSENKQFSDAVREIGRRLNRQLSRTEQRRLHDEISGQGLNFHEVIEMGLSLFST
jgi:hypothetical protein